MLHYCSSQLIQWRSSVLRFRTTELMRLVRSRTGNRSRLTPVELTSVAPIGVGHHDERAILFMTPLSSEIAGGKDYLRFSTGGTAGEGPGRFVIQNNTDAKEMMVFTAGGKVGFGTHDPETAFHVMLPANGGSELMTLGGNPHKGGFTAPSQKNQRKNRKLFLRGPLAS